MASSGAIKAGRAYVELFADNGPLQRGLKAAEGKLKSWGQGISATAAQLMITDVAQISAGVAAAFTFATSGANLHRLSAQTGATVEQLSALSYAAETVGGSLGDVQSVLSTLGQNLLAAKEGSEDMQVAFAQLGLNARKLLELPINEQFKAIADSLSRLGSEQVRANVAQRIFGGSATALMPLLRGGSQEIERLTGHITELGGVMTTGEAAQGAEFMATWAEIKFLIARIVTVVGGALLPMFKDLAQSVAEMLPKVIAWLQENKGLIVTAIKMAAAFLAAEIVLWAIGAVVSFLGTVFGILAAIISVCVTVIGALLSPIGLVIVAIGAAIAAVAYFSGNWDKLMASLQGSLRWLGDLFSEVWGGIVDALKAGDLEKALEIGLTGVKILWQKIWGGLKLEFYTWVAAIQQLFDDLIYSVRSGLASLFGDFAMANRYDRELRNRTNLRNANLARMQQEQGRELAELHNQLRRLIEEVNHAVDSRGGYHAVVGDLFGAAGPTDSLRGARSQLSQRGTFSPFGATALAGGETATQRYIRESRNFLERIARQMGNGQTFA